MEKFLYVKGEDGRDEMLRKGYSLVNDKPVGGNYVFFNKEGEPSVEKFSNVAAVPSSVLTF